MQSIGNLLQVSLENFRVQHCPMPLVDFKSHFTSQNGLIQEQQRIATWDVLAMQNHKQSGRGSS